MWGVAASAEEVPDDQAPTVRWKAPFAADHAEIVKRFKESPSSAAGYQLFFPSDTPQEIQAVSGGIVVAAFKLGYTESDLTDDPYKAAMLGLDNQIVVDCGGGVMLRYFNLNDHSVKEGDFVVAGQLLGTTAGGGIDPSTGGGKTGRYPYWCAMDVLINGIMVDPSGFFDLPIIPQK